MFKTVSLILPVLIPSWRFFKSVEPSPRVQWALLEAGSTGEPAWQDFQPRPTVVPVSQMIRRLFWNPAWNDALFVVSCAERIALEPTDHSISEIQRRILRDIRRINPNAQDALVQFRLVFVHENAAGMVRDEVFRSDPIPRCCGC
ncbi:MAG: hypothetical protein WA782_06120 [Sulfitobacter sp.]